MRGEMLETLRDRSSWDLVVIGGGATGLGTAVDAAGRGYRTLLVDAFDFAKGTSSRSTKLVHGGVRYLARGEIGLVREALRERGLMRDHAPHLVHDRAFLVPAYSLRDLALYGVGLKVYGLLAGKRGFGRSEWVSAAESLRRIPTLEPKGLRGGVLYHDGQFDDARFAVALLRTFLDLGGTALNYMPVTGLIRSADRISGVRTQDSETGEEFSLAARAVVNATGVYVDAIRRLDDDWAAPSVRPSRGVHVVLDRSFLPGDTAVMIPKTDDGRVLFAIPWHGRTLVGTTDTATDGVPIEPRPSTEEVSFLLSHAARYLTRDPRREDVLTIFAGLRPLLDGDGGGATAKLSREHAVLVSDSGLVSVTGGKWTTYRVMASDTVDQAAEVAGLPRKPCPTSTLRLHGSPDVSGDGPLASYGADAPDVVQMLAERPGWDELLHPALPYCVGEVAWAARHEMARQVEDVLARRTRALFLDARASLEAAPRVAEVLADLLGVDATWRVSQVEQYRALVAGYLPD